MCLRERLWPLGWSIIRFGSLDSSYDGEGYSFRISSLELPATRHSDVLFSLSIFDGSIFTTTKAESRGSSGRLPKGARAAPVESCGGKKGGERKKRKRKKKKEGKKSRFPFYLTNALLQYDDRCLRLGLNLRESSMSSAALHCAWVESLPGFLIPNPWGYIEMGKRNKTSCLFQFSLSIALVVFRWVLKGCFFFFFFFHQSALLRPS